MLGYILRFYRRNSLTITSYLIIAIFSGLLSGIAVLSYVYFPQVVASVTGVPEEIIHDAIENDVGSVLLFGNYDERHEFAKGNPSGAAAMPYDIEAKLMGPPYYWTTEEVHNKGFMIGFSDTN